MNDSHQILIVGGGPVGLTAALELNRRGFEVTIIDDDAEPTPESRAIAINPRTLDILEPSGVTERLLAVGHRINGLIAKVRGVEQFRLDISQIPHRFNFMLTLPQSETEKVIIAVLKERGVNVKWRTRLESFVSEREQYICSLMTTEGEKTLKVDRLIGADGSHSVVRKTLGFDFPGDTIANEMGLVDVGLSSWFDPYDHVVMNILDDNAFGFFPYAEGRGRLVMTHPNALDSLPRGMTIKEVFWQSAFRVSYRQVSSYQQGNVFLAGDAAHIHSPAGGRGMNLGIEDAATLAWLIETGQTSKYTALRHPVGKNVLKFTRYPTKMLMQPTASVRFAMQWIMPWGVKLSPVRNSILRMLSAQETPRPAWLGQ